MLALFARDKEAVLPKEMTDVEKLARSVDEIDRILRDIAPPDRPEPDQRIFIFQRQF